MQTTIKNFNDNMEKSTDILSAEDIKLMVKRTFGDDSELINYYIKSYSDERLGLLGLYSNLNITILKKIGTKEVHSFFVKSIPHDIKIQASLIDDSKTFFKEINFYKHILPELLASIKDKSWIAQCYLVKDDLLVFENLKSRNFALKGKILDLTHLKSTLTSLAKFHASSLLAEKRLGKNFNEIFPEILQESLFDRKSKMYEWYRSSVDVLMAVAKKIGLDASSIPETCDQIFEKLTTSKQWRNVLCHGDLKAYNFMFDDTKPEPNCVLVDFQILRYAPATSDVAQLVYLTSERELRKTHEIELLKHYHNVLIANLKVNSEVVDVPTFEDIWQEYTDMRAVGVIMAALCYPIILMDGKRSDMTDPDKFVQFFLSDRINLVLDTMQNDSMYNKMLTEIITELVQI